MTLTSLPAAARVPARSSSSGSRWTMKGLLPVALVVLLIVIGGGRLWAFRAFRLLSVEQKAQVLEVSSQRNIWLPLCLAVFAGIVWWGPGASVPAYYRPAVFASYAIVPFLLSAAASAMTLIRLSRLSLPSLYLRSARIGAVVLHVALLFVLGAFIYDVIGYAHHREQPRQTSSQAMKPTGTHVFDGQAANRSPGQMKASLAEKLRL